MAPSAGVTLALESDVGTGAGELQQSTASERRPTRLSAKARREEIYRLALTIGLASVEELSARFEVTASTIRRDLALLSGQGRLAPRTAAPWRWVRTPGGVAAAAHRPGVRAEAGNHPLAGIRGPARENILLDAGSTEGALAHKLHGFEKLSGTSPRINTLQELADSEGVEVDCLGGWLRTASQIFVGPLAEAALGRRNFDRVFLGADAVTAEEGTCEADHAQTRLKELMAGRPNTPQTHLSWRSLTAKIKLVSTCHEKEHKWVKRPLFGKRQ